MLVSSSAGLVLVALLSTALHPFCPRASPTAAPRRQGSTSALDLGMDTDGSFFINAAPAYLAALAQSAGLPGSGIVGCISEVQADFLGEWGEQMLARVNEPQQGKWPDKAPTDRRAPVLPQILRSWIFSAAVALWSPAMCRSAC